MEQLHKDLQADFESTLATSQDTEQQVTALRKERDVLLQQREDANERHEQDNNAWRAAVRKAEEAARKAAEEASSHARTVETLSMQIKNKDLALEQLQRDKESATVTKEELRTQMQSLSDDQSNTHAKAYALQKHAEKLESTLRECEDDLELQHVQTRNAQARVTALEHEVDAAQDLVRIAEAKVNSMAAENAQLTRESEELKKEVLTHRSESRKLRSLEVPVLTAMHKHKNRYMHKHRSSNFSPKMAMGEDSSLRLYLQESLSQESHSNLRQMKQAQAQVSILSTCDAYDHELLTDSGLNLYTIREQAEALERENADLRADLALTRKRVKELDVALLEADEQVRDLTRRGKAPPGRAGEVHGSGRTSPTTLPLPRRDADDSEGAMYERVKDSDSAGVSSMDARTSPLRHRRVEPSVSLNSKVESLPHPVSKGDKVAPRPNVSSPAVTKAAAAQARAAELSRAIQDQVDSFTHSSPRQFNLSQTYESRRGRTLTESARFYKD